MAQGSSVSFFCAFSREFEALCEAYDAQWLQRRRTLNTKILALLLWKLVSGRHGSVIVLNDFWCKSLSFLESLSQPVAVAGSSFCDARRKLCASFFRKINFLLNDMGDKAISERWFGHRIFCIDGTKINLPRTLLARGFSLPSPTSYYPQGLVSCLFNLINKTPYDFLFTKNQNELHAAKRLLGSLKKNDVIVYDRVFLSYAMLSFHLKQGLHAVFRAKEKNTLRAVTDFLSQKRSSDKLVTIDCKGFGEVTIRLVRYWIKGRRYCLVTTLIDQKAYPLSALKELYHARWGVEEFFKLSKSYLNLECFHSKTRKGIEQEIFAHFVLLHLAQVTSKLVSPEYQINRRHAVNQIAQNLENLFLSSTHALAKLLPWIMGTIARCRIFQRKGRSYPRRSRKPINRWQKNINADWARQRRASKASICFS